MLRGGQKVFMTYCSTLVNSATVNIYYKFQVSDIIIFQIIAIIGYYLVVLLYAWKITRI